MVRYSGWLWPDDITMPLARLREKAVYSTPPTPTWLLGNILKGGKHNDPEGKEDPGYPGKRYPRG